MGMFEGIETKRLGVKQICPLWLHIVQSIFKHIQHNVFPAVMGMFEELRDCNANTAIYLNPETIITTQLQTYTLSYLY